MINTLDLSNAVLLPIDMQQGFDDRAEEYALRARPTVTAGYDQVGVDFLGGFENPRRWFSRLDQPGTHIEVRRPLTLDRLLQMSRAQLAAGGRKRAGR